MSGINMIKNKYIFHCRWIGKYEYPFFVHIQTICIGKCTTCYTSIIWVYESSTLWKWRRNYLDNLSRWCRRYVFIKMMYSPYRIKREIVDSEYERILSKTINFWYIRMKKCKCKRWSPIFSKIGSISYFDITEYMSILVDKTCDFINSVSPYHKACMALYLSLPCTHKFTRKSDIAKIVDDREDDVDSSGMVGWLGGWIVHTRRTFEMRIRKWETEGNKLSKNFTIKK